MCVSKRDAPVKKKKKKKNKKKSMKGNICLSTSGQCLFVWVTVENERKVSKKYPVFPRKRFLCVTTIYYYINYLNNLKTSTLRMVKLSQDSS